MHLHPIFLDLFLFHIFYPRSENRNWFDLFIFKCFMHACQLLTLEYKKHDSEYEVDREMTVQRLLCSLNFNKITRKIFMKEARLLCERNYQVANCVFICILECIRKYSPDSITLACVKVETREMCNSMKF